MQRVPANFGLIEQPKVFPTVEISSLGETPLQYKDLVEFPGYRVGTDGSVWSRWNPRSHSLGSVWHKLSPVMNKAAGGYLQIRMNDPNGRRCAALVHILIITAFRGDKPSPEYICRHKNDDKLDNRVDNLFWGTREQNTLDAIRNGKIKALLSLEQVSLIKTRLARGETQRSIADSFKVSQYVVHCIANDLTKSYLERVCVG